jgi:methylmalonyl-CoA mutase
MLSAYDPWVNMLRGTVAAFAAGVGGADAVTVVPFDSPLGEPDAFGRRIARNVSALLIAESHVAAVTDPAGGAYAVEKLTDDLAAAAWAELQRIDAAGGVVAALDDGSLLGRVADVAARRDRDVATRTRPLTGLSEFPNLGETLPERVSTGSPADGSAVRRYGAAFEALRAEPATAHVFLATLGPVAAHTARAGFATNLLAAGGVGVDVAGATDGVDDLVAAYAGQPVVCLAGTDASYAEWGREAAEALRTKGATRVVVAGRPAEWADDSCALGVDAIDFLTRTREALR